CFFFQAEDGIRDGHVTGVQTCALPIWTSFASSEGAVIEQTIVNSGGGIEATAIADGELQRRSFPNSFRGHLRAAGYEHIRSLGRSEERRVGKECRRGGWTGAQSKKGWR